MPKLFGVGIIVWFGIYSYSAVVRSWLINGVTEHEARYVLRSDIPYGLQISWANIK